MVKIIGCILLIFVSTSCGIMYSSMLRKRIQSLGFFIKLLETFKMKIEYERCTIPELLNSHIDQDECADLLRICDQKLKDGALFCDAWNSMIDENTARLCLNKNDSFELKQFAREFGKTDLSGQISNLLLYIEVLKKRLIEAEKNASDKSRVAINTGVFAGLIVAILLI